MLYHKSSNFPLEGAPFSKLYNTRRRKATFHFYIGWTLFCWQSMGRQFVCSAVSGSQTRRSIWSQHVFCIFKLALSVRWSRSLRQSALFASIPPVRPQLPSNQQTQFDCSLVCLLWFYILVRYTVISVISGWVVSALWQWALMVTLQNCLIERGVCRCYFRLCP